MVPRIIFSGPPCAKFRLQRVGQRWRERDDCSDIQVAIAPPVKAVTDSRPDLPLPFARIVKRCLVKDPQRRYQSARDLQNDLEDLKQDVDSGVLSRPSGSVP